MKTRLLITGHRGFIAGNLIRHLQNMGDWEILPVGRSTTTSQLHEFLGVADFIFHLAGEVKPSAASDDFIRDNSQFTKTIIDYLILCNAQTPLLMASSSHAENPGPERGIYGQTKRESELHLERYRDHGGRILIYRLPHVFGEGAKPNHNSVVTTWIHNKIHQLPITVYDRAIPMTYCYVQDVVAEIADALLYAGREGYLTVPTSYSTSLGEVVDFIDDIAIGVERDHDFYNKLKSTYRYYLKPIA